MTVGEPAAKRWWQATVGLTLAAFAVAVLTAPGPSKQPALGLVVLLFLGSSVHVASTSALFLLPEVRGHANKNRRRYVVAPCSLIATSALLAAFLPFEQLRWLLLAFYAWQFFHFQKQNLGLVALAGVSVGAAALTRSERRSLQASGGAAIAALVSRPHLLQLSGNWPLKGLFPLAAAAFAVAVASGVSQVLRRPRPERPVRLVAMYLLAVFFPLPIFLFSSPYAAVAGMTIAHGLQYLVLVGLVLVGRSRQRAVWATGLTAIAVLGGLALAVTSHLHGSGPSLRWLFGAYLGAVMSHFVVDAGLWRLRDAFPRRFLQDRLPYLLPS